MSDPLNWLQMRFCVCSCILAAATLTLTGCRTGGLFGHKNAPSKRTPTAEKPVFTPANVLTGQVARANQAGRFIVITFPIGHLPAIDQRFGIYRNGLKVGDAKITGPQLDDSVVADITAGDAQVGDAVRN